MLFIDARQVFKQIDRAHREFTPEQIEFLANIVRLYRGEETEDLNGGGKLTAEQFQRKKADLENCQGVAEQFEEGKTGS